MEPVGIAIGAISLIAALSLGSRQLGPGIHFLDRHQFFSRHQIGKSVTEERFELVTQYAPNDPDIDIVFIHGIQETRDTAWIIEDETGRMMNWVRDVLPGRFPTARIMTYYYDTTLRSSEYLSRRTLLHEADQLLDRLSTLTVKDRPIIFVARSLGGLLLESALVSSYSSWNDDWRTVDTATVGIVFLDTPHGGSPGDVAASIWAAIEPCLSIEQIKKPTWRPEEFNHHARSLAYAMERFKPISADLPIHTIYQVKGVIHDSGDPSAELVNGEQGALSAIIDAIRSLIKNSGSTMARRQFRRQSTEALHTHSSQQFIEFSVGTNLPVMTEITSSQRILRSDDPHLGNKSLDTPDHYLEFPRIWPIVSLDDDSDYRGTNLALQYAYKCLSAGSDRPYGSIFLIKASNEMSIGMSFLDVCRKIIEHYSPSLGEQQTARALGIEEIAHMNDEEIISNPDLLYSVVEAVVQWLEQPQNNRWLLILEDMPPLTVTLNRFVLSGQQPPDSIYSQISRTMFPLQYLPRSNRHIICTGKNQPTWDLGLDQRVPKYKGLLPYTIPPSPIPEDYGGYFASDGFNLGNLWTSQELGEVGLRILNLCLVISDESCEHFPSEIFIQCSDLLVSNIAAMHTAESAVEDTLRYLTQKGVLVVSPGSRFNRCRVSKPLRQHCRGLLQMNFAKEFPSTHDLAATAWRCLERSYASTTTWKDHVKQWDLGTFLADNCSATVRWCNGARESLWLHDRDWSALGQLCERHSAYTTATILYECGYIQQQRSVNASAFHSAFPSVSLHEHVETTLRLARMYMLTDIHDKAEEKCAEAMKMIEGLQPPPIWLLVDAVRLQASLGASQGSLDVATGVLESVLKLDPPLGIVGSGDNKSDSDDTTILSAVRDLSAYLARRGDYDAAASLLQRSLYSLRHRRQRNQPAMLTLLDSLAALYRHQGELRQAERYYTEAQRLMELWLGSGHPSAALRGVRRGVVVGLQGRHREARKLFSDAVTTARSSLGAHHPDVLRAREHLALCIAVQGFYPEASYELKELRCDVGETRFSERESTTNRIDKYLAMLNNIWNRAGAAEELDVVWRQSLESDKDEIWRLVAMPSRTSRFTSGPMR